MNEERIAYESNQPEVVASEARRQVNEPSSVASRDVVRTTSSRKFAVDSMIAALVGTFLLVIGMLAMLRAGLGGTLRLPVVEVLGFTHTAVLGIAETAIGLMLLIAGASQSRSGALFLGVVLAIAGFIGAVQIDSFKKYWALEKSFAWLVAIAGLAVALAALLVPRTAVRTRDLHVSTN